MAPILLLVAAENDPEDRIRRGVEAAAGRPVLLARGPEEAAAAVREAEILLAFSPSITASLLANARRLRWIQLLGSGYDGVLEAVSARPGLLVTSGRGAQAAPVSEAVLALMLALARDLPRIVRNQDERKWERRPARLLKGSTVTIVGIGAIAAALGPKCKALGMEVVGVSSAPRPVPGFDAALPLTALHCALGRADYVVVLTPLTASTRRLIDGAAIAAMKPGACLVNAARGPVVDEAALAAALRDGRIAGAALDVFEEEPLPSSSPLWSAPATIVSPHVAGLNLDYAAELLPIIGENLRCFFAGDVSAMRNVISR